MNASNYSSAMTDDHDLHQHIPHPQQPASDEPFYELIKQPKHLVVLYSLAYAALFLLAVVGNVLVIAVVCRNSTMHNVTNVPPAFPRDLTQSGGRVPVQCTGGCHRGRGRPKNTSDERSREDVDSRRKMEAVAQNRVSDAEDWFVVAYVPLTRLK